MSASRWTSRPVTVPSFLAVIVMSWIWSRPWWAVSSDSERVSVHLTGLPSFCASATQSISSGMHPDLAAEAAAHVGGDDPQLALGHAECHRRHRAQDVRDLGGRRRW